mmetsp:Transcript_17854/g.54891  ORF Transcript_17854/g.54891 Transcript_17854/m.54891 type:complete len:405 (+) Transcript_17854:129-1343(+)
MSFSTGYSVLKPAPPKICTASLTTFAQCSAAKTLAMDANIVLDAPVSMMAADLCTSKRAASMPVAMSASMKLSAWCSAMGLPMVLRSLAYASASSVARRATPTAPAATGGRVLSKAPMAILKPAPSWPSTFSAGTTTSSKKSGRVSEQRWPMLMSLSPTVMPGESASTMKPVIFRPTLASASVTARTKYQPPSPDVLATPPFVIHIFDPFRTQASPCLAAFVWIAATSEPAPASDTPYAHLSGASVMRPRYFFFWASVPARITGICASVLASIAVLTPEQPQASSSWMTQPSTAWRPGPPYASGMCAFTRPISHISAKISSGNAMVRSSSAAAGAITSRAYDRATSWKAFWSSVSAKQRPPEAWSSSERTADAESVRRERSARRPWRAMAVRVECIIFFRCVES